KLFPASMDGIQPTLRVVVDTIPPIVNLRPLPPRSGEVGVGWEIRDEYFDENQLDAVRLEYRTVGGTNWTPLPRRGPAPRLYWNPEANDVLEIRLRARDRAGNWGEATTNVSLTGQAGGQGQPPGTQAGEGGAGGSNSGPSALDPDRRMVNSKTVHLNFEIKDK